MKNKFLCIHGHFYQPPRENPWLGIIEKEKSASPFSNWNQKILHECYGPNSNNYQFISFDFGPTLLSWIEKHSPRVYLAILESDRLSLKSNNGHGNAIAQVYNHMIMPLQTLRDKKTQIKWGMEYFSYKFKRNPEGFWLSETAVDEETLEVLIEHNIKFTILSPSQAKNFRRINRQSPFGEKGHWEECHILNFDTTNPYRWFSKLQKGRFIDIFFYNDLSKSIVPEINWDKFYNKLLKEWTADSSHQLVSIVSDGENYGHHIKNGDIALSELLLKIKKEKGVHITNFGEYLEKNPPEYEIEIVFPSSWSCPHGVERWRNDCGCKITKSSAINQKWRKPLRESLNWLSEKIVEVYEKNSKELFIDCHKSLDDYVVHLKEDHLGEIKKYLSLNTKKHMTADDMRKLLLLLEMQKNRMLMFTSCGWFFDDMTNIETLQILKHAARAIDIAKMFSVNLEEEFKNKLTQAKSNYNNLDGKQIYTLKIEPLKTNLEKATANHLILKFLNANFQFSGHMRHHYKIIEEKSGVYNTRHLCFYLVKTETSDTFEQKLFSSIITEDDTEVIKCYMKETANAQEHSHSIHPILEAIENKTFESQLLHKFSSSVYDVSGLPEEHRQLVYLILKSRQNDKISNLYHRWFSLLRASGSGLVSKDILSMLTEWTQHHIDISDIPFSDEIMRQFMVHFEFLMEHQSEELFHMIDWIEFIINSSFCVYTWEIKQIISTWSEETRNCKIKNESFLKSLKQILNLINFNYDNKKIVSKKQG